LTHVRKPVIRFGLLTKKKTVEIGNVFVAFVVTTNEPQTYVETLWSSDREEWKKTIITEFLNLEHTGVFNWVEILLKRKKAVGGHLVCKNKLNKLEKLTKWKICVIIRGFSQVPEKNFNKTFVSILKFMILYIILAIVVFHDFK